MFLPVDVLPNSFVLDRLILWETLVIIVFLLLPVPCVTVCNSTGTITTLPHAGIEVLREKKLIIPEILLNT